MHMHEIIVSTGCLTPTHRRYIPLICSSTQFQGATHALKNPDRRSGATSLWRRPRRQSSRQHRWYPRPRQPRRTTNFAARAAHRPVFLPDRKPRVVRSGRIDPRPHHRGTGRGRSGTGCGAGQFLFERRAPGLYHNTAVVFDAMAASPGKYRKMHIPDDPGFYEKFYFTPGDLGFEPIDTSGRSAGRAGLLGSVVPGSARA
jgi:hypothetical protein